MNRLLLILAMASLYASETAGQNLVFEQGFENHPDAVEVLALTATPSHIYEGGSTTLSWQVKDASSCTTTDGTAEWQALSPAINGGSFEVTTLTTAGNYPFTLTCIGPIGDPSDWTVNVVVQVPPPVDILSLEATPETITEGDNTTISWTLANAIDCTATGGTVQWRALSFDGSDGNAVISDINNVGDYSFDLTCEGLGGDLDIATVEVSVEAASSCPEPTLDGSVFLWNDFWETPQGQSFPSVGLSRISKQVASRRFMGIKFNTGNVVDNGQFALINSVFSAGVRLGAISQCEGRFEVPARCKATWGTGGGIKWSTDGTPNSCELEPNTDYYVNFTYTDGVDPDSSRCDLSISGYCYLVVDYQRSR